MSSKKTKWKEAIVDTLIFPQILGEYLRQLLCSKLLVIRHSERPKWTETCDWQGVYSGCTLILWWPWEQCELRGLPGLTFSPLWSNRWVFLEKKTGRSQTKTVLFILRSRSQDPSISSTRQTTESFPAQILCSYTLSVWDTADLNEADQMTCRTQTEYIWGHQTWTAC